MAERGEMEKAIWANVCVGKEHAARSFLEYYNPGGENRYRLAKALERRFENSREEYLLEAEVGGEYEVFTLVLADGMWSVWRGWLRRKVVKGKDKEAK